MPDAEDYLQSKWWLALKPSPKLVTSAAVDKIGDHFYEADFQSQAIKSIIQVLLHELLMSQSARCGKLFGGILGPKLLKP